MGSLAAIILSACGAVVPEPLPTALPETVFRQEPATAVPTPSHTPSPVPTHTLPPSPTATLDPAAFETSVAATNAVEYAKFQATATAVLQALKETVQPRMFQSMRSPDGAHLAEIIILDCAQIQPATEMANSYEVLRIDGKIVSDQFLYCGGLGAAGLGGLFWSENSRFFYFTHAREGWPDGGGPWIRPIARYDTGTGMYEYLAMPVNSVDGHHVTGGQGSSLVVWDFEEGDVARFPFPEESQSWVNAAAWSPDEREVAFAVQECAKGGCDAILMRANLETMQVTELARLPNAQVNQMSWPEPNTIVYFDYNVFNDVVFKLDNGALATVTPQPQNAVQPARMPYPTLTPFPTYAPEEGFPLERYPFESRFLQPVEGPSRLVVGHGCPSLSGVEIMPSGAAAAPTAKELGQLLDEVRSGEVARLRRASDRAYWPISGLGVRKETARLPANAEVAPASESPLAGEITRACGSEVVARSWWVRVEEDGNTIQDYFFIRRQEKWLVWNSIYSFE